MELVIEPRIIRNQPNDGLLKQKKYRNYNNAENITWLRNVSFEILSVVHFTSSTHRTINLKGVSF